MSDPAPGKVITFYSYKGGTGRSQALANVAWILASNWRRVLVIDWDLEAPGLHRYFAPFLFDESLAETDGLIEFVLEYAAKALECAGGDPGADGAWYKPLADISRFAVSVDYPFDGGGIIDLVPAGRQGPFYGERVRSFDWHNFYDRLGGGSFLEETRARFIGEYNYVLIDSRTGVSDISGICTAQMPDVLVACFTANNQSIDGTAAVAASARRQARPRAKPAVLLPVITRVDNSEKHKLERRRELARVEFDDLLPPEWGDEQREAYWGAAQVPYIPFYAYEEVLAPFDDQPGDAASMLTAMERLADTITGGDVKRLGVRPTKKECLEIQAKYARHKKLPPETREASAGEAVYDVYLSFRSRDRGLVRPIAERLRQVGVRFYFDEQDLQPGRNWQNDLQKALDASPACVVFVGEDLGVWQAQEVIGTVSQRLAASRGRFRVIPAILPGSSPARLPEFLRDIAPVDFNVDPDGAFDRLLNGIRGVAPSPVPSADTCPYKGLEPFDFKDARLFFGREDLVKQMLESLRLALAQRGASRLFGIIGASGSGKSSLARAGLLEALRRGEVEGSAQWPQVVLRPGPDPLESLVVALAQIPDFGQNSARLSELLKAMLTDKEALHLALRVALSGTASSPSDRRAVILIDQAEEAFTVCRDKARRDAFLSNLLHAAWVESGATVVVFTARDDSDMSDYPVFPTGSPDQPYFRAVPLGREELRRAIEKPAELVGLSVEPALVNLLLQDLYQQPGRLPLLQATLVRLWERREGRTLTVRAYEAIGGVKGVLFVLAEEAYGRLDPPGRQIFQDVLLSLASLGHLGRLSPGGFRSAGTRPDQVDAVVRGMVGGHLLITERDPIDSDPVVLPAHDALVRSWPRLIGWKEERDSALSARAERAEGVVTFGTTAVKPALAVYAVWHPRWGEGAALATQIYSRFARDVKDPLARGIGIPVYFRSDPTFPAVTAPTPIALDDARQTAVVVFVSSHMAVDEAWMAYLRVLIEEAQKSEKRHRVLPVAVSPAALRSDPVLSRRNFIRLYDFRDEMKIPRLLGILTGELGRLLLGAPGADRGEGGARLFLSHAKQDGMLLVEAITAHVSLLRQELNLDLVADDIRFGDQFHEWLEDRMKDAIYLALRTDSYASRQWCRSEVLAAKRNGVPMVVVDALERVEPRSFPYLGNVPTIRWTGTNAQEVVDLAVQEWLRLLHVRARLESLRETGRIPADARVLCRPPELLDHGAFGPSRSGGATDGPGAVVVYPDPPLGPEELGVLASLRPDVAFITPTGADRAAALAGRRVGLSLSEPEDLSRYGLGRLHLEDALVELVRQLLAQEASLAYGGDLSKAGITDLLVDVMRTQSSPDGRDRRRLANFLAWPIHLDLDLESRAALVDVADYHLIPPPNDLVTTLELDPTRAPSAASTDPLLSRYIQARCLTAMRQQMIESCDALLALGGRRTGYLGKYPGIVEEAYLALRAGKPLFLLGGFGGSALAVIEALQGRVPAGLEADRSASDPGEAPFVEVYNHWVSADPKLGEPIDYAGLYTFFASHGMTGLNNGLTAEENGRLFTTVYLDEAIFLVLTGLKRLFGRPQQGAEQSQYFQVQGFPIRGHNS